MFLAVLISGLQVACNTIPVNDDKAEALAFPNAQGGGCKATGGRKGVIYHVTSLADNVEEEGTLRYALNQKTTRTILFDVSGRIDLNGELRIRNGNVTIAGQSAPGDGICISGYPVIIDADNVIIRFMRFRMGDEQKFEGDALTCRNHKNVIVDHCSFSWSTDECVSCYGNTNFTLQYCFITESLRSSVHSKVNHGYGGIWGGTNATFHHNLLAHHDSRNPRFDHDYVDATCRGPLDFVNNVVYNWGSNSAYGGESVGTARTINFQNNYFKPGPATKESVKARLVNPWTACDNCLKTHSGTVVPPQIYMVDNYMYGSADVTADNWQGSTIQSSRASSRFPLEHSVTLESAEDAFETVLAKAGCSLVRDAVDTRIVEEVRGGTYTYKGSNSSTGGLIDSQTDIGGWPMYSQTEKQQDSDGDGLPDAWEVENGLNPNSFLDGSLTTLHSPYTNLEVFLNSIVSHLY